MTVEATIEKLRARPGTGETIRIIDPVTEQEIADFVDGGAAAIDDAVARARATFEFGVWHQKPQTERAQVLWRVAELLEAQADDLAQIDSLNTGMPLPQAQRNIAAAVEFFRYFSGWCTKINGIRPRRADVGRPLRVSTRRCTPTPSKNPPVSSD